MRELTEVKTLDKYNWDELFNGSVWEVTAEDVPEYNYLSDWLTYARHVAKYKYQMKLTYRTQQKGNGGEPSIIWMKAIKN